MTEEKSVPFEDNIQQKITPQFKMLFEDTNRASSKHLASIVIFCALLLGICGCNCPDGKARPSELQLFKRNNPNLFKNYLLRESNIDRYLEIHEFSNESVISELTQLQTKNPGNEGLCKLADYGKVGMLKWNKDIKKQVDELKQAAIGGVLYEFQYAEDNKVDWGFFVLKDGKMTKRVSLLSTIQ
jgi:hypothetical protein